MHSAPNIRYLTVDEIYAEILAHLAHDGALGPVWRTPVTTTAPHKKGMGMVARHSCGCAMTNKDPKPWLAERNKNMYKNADAETLARYKANVSAAQKKRYERQEERDKASLIRKQVWEKQSEEARVQSLNALAEGRARKWDTISDESRKSQGDKISKAVKERYAAMSPEEKAISLKKWNEAGINAAVRISAPEKLLAARFDAEGIVYEHPKRMGRYLVDFYLPAQNRVVELYGCYWHQCGVCGYVSGAKNQTHEQIVKRNSERQAYFVSRGYEFVVVWEHQMKDR